MTMQTPNKHVNVTPDSDGRFNVVLEEGTTYHIVFDDGKESKPNIWAWLLAIYIVLVLLYIALRWWPNIKAYLSKIKGR